jgi:hypothetical protein
MVDFVFSCEKKVQKSILRAKIFSQKWASMGVNMQNLMLISDLKEYYKKVHQKKLDPIKRFLGT